MHTPQKIVLLLFCLLLFACEEDLPSDPTSGIGSDPSDVQDPIPDPDPDPEPDPDPTPSQEAYLPLGVGGGGAMSGVAINPYNNTWYVGTDMGTLFRSADRGQSWNAINHYEAQFDSHLPHSTSPGFSSDGTTVFYANAGKYPKISYDNGLSFTDLNLTLPTNTRILYWKEDSQDANIIFVATTKGLWRSTNKGSTWVKTAMPSLNSIGTFIDHFQGQTTLYHATADQVYKSTDLGNTIQTVYNPSYEMRLFTGGRTADNLTLAVSDNDGQGACAWALAYLSEWGQTSIDNTLNNCGYVWINQNNQGFTQTDQVVGNHLKMAENDAFTIYATGGKEWIRQRGTQIFVSRDAGDSWNLKLDQMNWDNNYASWPSQFIEYSAVAIDVGWWDSGYESFTINNLNSSEAAGTGYFFLHSTENYGDYWDAPFTEFKGQGSPGAQKNWQTAGIEVISVYRLKHHPINSDLIYAATADVGGMVSEDAGESFRLCKAAYNSNYDYAFDTSDDQVVFAASGNEHDYPEGWHANATISNGGIYKSNDRGLNWQRLTPNGNGYARQFLSVGYYTDTNELYGGTQGGGIAYSSNGGQTWQWLNNGFPSGNKIIPQIEIDPENGNVYALLTGDAPSFSNRANTGIYFLDRENNSTTWQLLRGNVAYPSAADPGYQVWWYPTSFAIDFSDPQRNTLWLTDYENKGNWLMTGAWKSSDRGQNWERKIQFTHAVAVQIDPENSDHVYVSGSHHLDNSWGNGGQLFTEDGGETWKQNMEPNLQANARNVTFDPTNSENIFYTYFGGGILKGPNPIRKPASVEVEIVTD